MGKSTVAGIFLEAGVPVFDADAEVHELQRPGSPLLPEIERAFPGSTGPSGVDREALGKQVFGDREKLARLEAIIHPHVAQRRQGFLAANKDKPLLVFDIPLLFEKQGWQEVDAIVVVSAPADMQRARVLARPGMTEEKFHRILGQQMPDDQKRARADYVIDTGTSLEQTRIAVQSLIGQLGR